MSKNYGSTHFFQYLASSLLCTGLFVASANVQAEVAQAPLSLSEGVPPNMIFTMDDSTSMNYAFTPDAINNVRSSRRGKSAYFNPNYYNPDTNYRAPSSFNSSGLEVALSTSFSKAYYDGFLPNKNSGADWDNLSSSYKVSWNYNKTKNGVGSSYTAGDNAARDSILAPNFEADFSCGIGISNNNSTRSCTTAAGISIDIRRGANANSSNCTATSSSLPGTVGCTRTGNNNASYVYTASWSARPTRAYYYVYDESLSGCNGTKNDDDCYQLKFVEAQEEQNFANWYSFYRNRALSTITAASLAFYDLSPSVRLTWQSLIHCTNPSSGNTNCGANQFRPYSADQRSSFFSWLQTSTRFDVAGGTPLRSAMRRSGEFLQGDTAWQQYPGGSGNTSSNTYACRPSYHIVMTDGMWNSDNNITAPSSHDNTSVTLPDGKVYKNTIHPFADATNNTVADMAMHYWATDLKPSLENKVSPYIPFKSGNDTADYWDPRNNPATWQSMTNFIMGLGLTESLNNASIPWEGNTFQGTGYSELKAGTSWPAASADSPNNVYDLWHAAINSRGEFFSVDSPDAMVQAFADILSRIADRKSTASKPAVNSGMEDDGTGNNFVRYFYQTSYASDENWSGDLKRIKRIASTDSIEIVTELWSAQAELNSRAASSRNIKIASTGTTGFKDFSWGEINSGANTPGTLAYDLRRNPEDGTLDPASVGEQRLNFIRGSRNGEGTTFRQRIHVLGDMYSSTPAVVTGPRYLESFGNRLEGNDAYTKFINTIKARNSSVEDIQPRPHRVYVGGNDGMLHGFDTETGEETFAFIPTAVFPKLNKLTGKNYSHEFYVDGSPVVADVYFGNEWRTILVGTLRAGGKALFALDITTPGQEKLLWEFDESDVPDSNAVKPGYSFSKPTIARLHNGKWAVVTGNGYEGAGTQNGKAALYIIDAQTGALVKSLEVQGADGIKNGLSTPRLADYNNDGIADYAYAGDLQGNLWRFDLLGAGASPTRAGNIYGADKSTGLDGFKVSYGGTPMFSATSTTGSTRQPITAPPSLIRHPSKRGYLVIFGTGKYFESGDKDGVKTHAQSLYGIWDTETKAEATTAISINRSDLEAQQIESTVTSSVNGVGSRNARTITNNPVGWFNENGTIRTRGWYVDLRVGTSAFDGEMLIEDMAALSQTIFLQTLVPNDDPCDSGASNWTYAINPFTGGRTSHHAFDYTGTNNEIVSGLQQAGEGGISISSTPGAQFELSTGSDTIRIYPDPTSIGRQSWRIVDGQ
ncbi:pilus assembly protein [Halopseudomonas pelagia]|uniref:pilus assembly protein n=1 Tax=Halopseudomonas pelagia TaxID=553151 RepID=UPI0030D7B26A